MQSCKYADPNVRSPQNLSTTSSGGTPNLGECQGGEAKISRLWYRRQGTNLPYEPLPRWRGWGLLFRYGNLHNLEVCDDERIRKDRHIAHQPAGGAHQAQQQLQ